MKKFFLFAMLSIVSALGMNAQTWTAPTIQGEDPVAGQQYKVMNVETGMFLDMGKAWFGWATTAILSNTGINFTMQADGSNWKFIRTGNQGVFTSGNGIAGDAMHVDNTAHTYGITKLASGYYHIHDTGGDASSLCWGNDGTTVGVVAHADATASGWMCDWVFIQPANVENVANVYNARLALYNEYLKAYAEGTNTNAAATVYNNSNATVDELNAATEALHQARYEHALAVASNSNPRDITEFVLTNADFSAGNISGWETNYVSGQQATNIGYQGASYSNTYTEGGNTITVTISQFIEAWKPGATLGDGYLRQTVSGLPEGKFVLEADGIATWQNDDSRVITGAQLFITADGVTYKTDMSTRNGAPQHFTTEFMNTGEGDVIFGLRTVNATCNWLCADNFRVKFYGIDLSPYETQLAAAVAEAQALQGTIPTAAYNELNSVVTANNKTYTTSKGYAAAIAAIQEAIATATQIQASYSHYNEVKAAALAAASNTNTTASDAAANAATSVAEINAAIATLRQALLTALPNATMPAVGYIDVTAAMIENPTVRQNVEGWNIDNVGRPYDWSTGPTTNYNETEFYQSTFDFNQSISLSRGTWEFGVTGFHRAGNHNTHFYAGEDKILIPGVESNVVNSMADAQTYFNNGNGKVALKFLLEQAGSIKIGILNEDTETDRWTIFRDFTLKYYGPVDYTIYEEQWAGLVADANAAKTNHPNVTGSELTSLNAAIADAPNGSSKANYLEKIQSLDAAIAAFNAAIPSYDAFTAAKEFTLPYAVEPEGMAEAKNAVPTDAADAVAKTNAINAFLRAYYESNAMGEGVNAVDMTELIGQANAPASQADITAWTYSDNIDATDATIASNEQFTQADGTQGGAYYDGGDLWGQSAYKASYKQNIMLAPGKYLLTVTSRASQDTKKFELYAGENTTEMVKIGAGVGTGVFDRGWNDQSVEFVVSGTTAQSVEIGVNIEQDKEHNWYSFTRFRLVQLESYAVEGDVDGNGVVDVNDLQNLINAILGKGTVADGDLDNNGVISVGDVTKLVNIIKSK